METAQTSTGARGLAAWPSARCAALPPLVGLLLALAIVGGHLWMLGGDASVFVRAAPPFAQPDTGSPSLRLLDPTQAYDGQFFYRLAVDPSATREVGVSLDHPSYRQQRILYPLIVRVLSVGEDAWVPVLLVAVNVAGLAVLGILGSRLAIALKAPGWWGVALPLWVGFSFSLARDLSEIVQSCFLVGTLLAVQRGRWHVAAVLMPLAVLARETAVILAASLLASALFERCARRAPTHHAWSAGLAGLVCYVGIQAALWARWGTLPLATASAANLSMPMSAPLRYLSEVGPLGRIEFAAFTLLVVLAILTARVPGYVRLALIGYVVMALCLSTSVWAGDAAWLRATTEAAMLAWVSIFHGGARRAAAAITGAAVLWPAVARWAIGT